MIEVHVALLLASVVIAFTAVVAAPTKPCRIGWILAVGLLPFLATGACSILLKTMDGPPTIEWIVPAISAIAVILCCRSKRIAIRGYAAILAMMIGLLVNFFTLVQNGYTVNPLATSKSGKNRQRNLIEQCVKQLESTKPEGGMYASGSIFEILSDESFNHADTVFVENDWHTPLTQLHRVVRVPGILWTEGGTPEEAARRVIVLPQIAD